MEGQAGQPASLCKIYRMHSYVMRLTSCRLAYFPLSSLRIPSNHINGRKKILLALLTNCSLKYRHNWRLSWCLLMAHLKPRPWSKPSPHWIHL